MFFMLKNGVASLPLLLIEAWGGQDLLSTFHVATSLNSPGQAF